MAIPATAQSPLTEEPKQLGTPWATFSKDVQIAVGDVAVEIGTLFYDPEAKELSFWAKRTREVGYEEERIDWTSSSDCPVLRDVLKAMEAVPAPAAAVPRRDRRTRAVFDGALYHLQTSALYADYDAGLFFRSNVNTPLARFVDESLEALEPCWSDAIPKRET